MAALHTSLMRVPSVLCVPLSCTKTLVKVWAHILQVMWNGEWLASSFVKRSVESAHEDWQTLLEATKVFTIVLHFSL